MFFAALFLRYLILRFIYFTNSYVPQHVFIYCLQIIQLFTDLLFANILTYLLKFSYLSFIPLNILF